MKRSASLVVAALALVGCSKKNDTAGDDASVTMSSGSSSPSSSSYERAPWPPYQAPPPPDGGAASLLAKHFEGVPANQLETTSVELTSPGRRATLVKIAGKPTSEAKPFLYVSDDDGRHVLWARERPVAGITPPVGAIALSSGPADRVSLAACDPPTGIIALRIMDTDGAPFADFQAMSNETCEAVSLAYWRKRGWLIVIARAGATRAQLVKENGGMAWPGGLDVGVRSREGALAPPTIAFDTDDTFLVGQIAQPSGEVGSPFSALVFRYDAEGTAIWPQATTIPIKGGAAGQTAKMQKRYDGVAISLADKTVVIKPSGAFAPVP